MTRKLAVTVFAMSLTLVGCGSSSTTKQDASIDAKPDGITKPDATPDMPDTAVVSAPDTLPDVPKDLAPDTTPDTPPRVDVAIDTAADAADGGLLPSDTRPADTRPDGGVDVTIVKRDAAPDAPAVDAPDAGDGAALEVGTVDGGDGGQD